MAAGQGFKTFTTGEVLTAADVNGYLMQGVNVFADATARDAAITSPQEGQFAYLKDTNVTTYYTGSAWTNLDTTGMVNPMTTTGDTIYSSSGSTPARLGIGSTGQVLTVSGGLPTWANASSGGMTSIASGSLSGASLSLSSIPSGYVDLVLYIRGAQGSAANQITMTINGVTGGSNYSGGTLTASYTERVNAGFIAASGGNAIANSTFMSVRFFDYLNSHSGIINTVNSSSAATANRSFNFFSDTNQNAITSITLSVSGANWSAGTYVLYGVK